MDALKAFSIISGMMDEYGVEAVEVGGNGNMIKVDDMLDTIRKALIGSGQSKKGRHVPYAKKNMRGFLCFLQTPPVICEKCGNDLSVDERTGGCVSNHCPWCGTRKPKTI